MFLIPFCNPLKENVQVSSSPCELRAKQKKADGPIELLLHTSSLGRATDITVQYLRYYCMRIMGFFVQGADSHPPLWPNVSNLRL